MRACVVWCFFFWGGFVVKEFPLGELFEQFSLEFPGRAADRVDNAKQCNVEFKF